MYCKNTDTFIHLTIQVCISSINNLSVTGTVLGAGESAMNKRQVTASHEAYPPEEGERQWSLNKGRIKRISEY